MFRSLFADFLIHRVRGEVEGEAVNEPQCRARPRSMKRSKQCGGKMEKNYCLITVAFLTVAHKNGRSKSMLKITPNVTSCCINVFDLALYFSCTNSASLFFWFNIFHRLQKSRYV